VTDVGYERLSALDSSFLEIEDSNAHMHIGSVGIYDAAPLTRPDGGLDFERIATFFEGQMHKVPRFRQKLAMVPRLDHPFWIDDGSFNIRYHLRHTALPAPGSLRMLKRLAGRIMSQQLDRGKPLWENWVVEGIEGGRFAVIGKIHHCVADGISGTDLATAALGVDRDDTPEPGPPWKPRPPPSEARLLVNELSHRAGFPLGVARAGIRALSEPSAVLKSLGETARDLSELAVAGLGKVSDTPLNEPIGPHRRFDWNRMDLAKVKAIGKQMDAKVNDVVLSVLAAAIRELLERRDLKPEELDFRVMIPVSLRNKDESKTTGNRISNMIVPLPLADIDPLTRLRQVNRITRECKASGRSRGMETLTGVMEISDTLTHLLTGIAARSHAVSMVVTNVPGPPIPLYLLGAQLIDIYPLVPLAKNQALGVATFSYNGGLHWGFNSDWDRVPDLHDLALAVGMQFETLVKAVGERA
jgi:WS/DGAT/MGAT family acyltransferase